jgi:hypothetical protein
MNKSNYKKHSDIKTMCCDYSYNDQSKLSNTKFISQFSNVYNLNMWENDLVPNSKYVNDYIRFFKRPIIRPRDVKFTKN